MKSAVYRFFSDDHRRLESLLDRATATLDAIALDDYGEFRAGLLKHISMEEKLLFPAVERLRGGVAHPLAARLRLDHGAIAALLVPSPSPTIIAALRSIIARHDALEEGPGGIYEAAEQLPGDLADELLNKLRSAPPVPTAPHNNKPGTLAATRRALERAGYNLDDFDVVQ